MHTNTCGSGGGGIGINYGVNYTYNNYGYCSPTVYTGGYTCSTGSTYYGVAPAPCEPAGYWYSGDFNGYWFDFNFSFVHSSCTLVNVETWDRYRYVMLDQYWDGFHWYIVEEQVWVPGTWAWTGGCRTWVAGYWTWQVIDQQQLYHTHDCFCMGF